MHKSQRLKAIEKHISGRHISSQAELLRMLKAEGYNVTQATLSRDLKFLKAVKLPRGKGYKYTISKKFLESQNLSKQIVNNDIITTALLGINFSNNIIVIRTLPGYANSIAVVIDNLQLFEIIGTVAGDDTIIAILEEGTSRANFIKSITMKIPKLKNKFKS